MGLHVAEGAEFDDQRQRADAADILAHDPRRIAVREVLAGVEVMDTTAAACADLGVVFATTARDRALTKLVMTPERAMAEARCASAGVELRVPRPALCTDNGAMVAALGAQLVARGRQPSQLGIPADSSLPVQLVSV